MYEFFTFQLWTMELRLFDSDNVLCSQWADQRQTELSWEMLREAFVCSPLENNEFVDFFHLFFSGNHLGSFVQSFSLFSLFSLFLWINNHLHSTLGLLSYRLEDRLSRRDQLLQFCICFRGFELCQHPRWAYIMYAFIFVRVLCI